MLPAVAPPTGTPGAGRRSTRAAGRTRPAGTRCRGPSRARHTSRPVPAATSATRIDHGWPSRSGWKISRSRTGGRRMNATRAPSGDQAGASSVSSDGSSQVSALVATSSTPTKACVAAAAHEGQPRAVRRPRQRRAPPPRVRRRPGPPPACPTTRASQIWPALDEGHAVAPGRHRRAAARCRAGAARRRRPAPPRPPARRRPRRSSDWESRRPDSGRRRGRRRASRRRRENARSVISWPSSSW